MNDDVTDGIPSLEVFCRKLGTAIEGSGRKAEFLEKWGLDGTSDLNRLLEDNVQGGYDSYRHSILALPHGRAALSIGPGMGLAEFLLSEVYEQVFVAEPDSENCDLIRAIAGSYVTERGISSGQVIEPLNAGLSITPRVIEHWSARRAGLKNKGASGSVLNFAVDSTTEVGSVLPGTVDRVYLHKVLTSLSVCGDFESLLREMATFISTHGVITWAEPDYIFQEILEVDDDEEIRARAASSLAGNMNVETACYEVDCRVPSGVMRERWVLLSIRRENDAEGR